MVLFFTAWLYNTHGSYVSRDPWPLAFYTPYGGRSSCSRVPNIATVVYNPNGLKYEDVSALDIAFTYCPYTDSRWADNTDIPFRGTNEELVNEPSYVPCPGDCTIASKFPEDYAMNLGRGLADGWYLGESPENTRLCPKVTRDVNSQGKLGVGNRVPATCMYTFVQAGLIEEQDFYPQEYFNLICTLCPGYLAVESENVGGIRAFFVWCVVWFAVIMTWSLYLTWENRTKWRWTRTNPQGKVVGQ